MVKQQTFERGDTVYDYQGRAYCYEQALNVGPGHLVYPMYEEHYGDECYTATGRIEIFEDTLFLEAPAEKYCQEIVNKKAELDKLFIERESFRKQIEALKEEVEAVKAMSGKFESFQPVIDYLEGKITHAVIKRWDCYQVLTMDEVLVNCGERDDWPNAIALCAVPTEPECRVRHRRDKQRKSITWNVSKNPNSDFDHPRWTEFFPFASESEAKEFVSDRFLEEVEESISERKTSYYIDEFLKKNPWLEPPQSWTDHLEAEKSKAKAEELAKVKARLAELEGADE